MRQLQVKEQELLENKHAVAKEKNNLRQKRRTRDDGHDSSSGGSGSSSNSDSEGSITSGISSSDSSSATDTDESMSDDENMHNLGIHAGRLPAVHSLVQNPVLRSNARSAILKFNREYQVPARNRVQDARF